MAHTLTITDAGRAALINAQNIGTNAVVIDRIGISTSHVTGDLKALTSLPNERKRLTTFGGEVVADDVLHVTLTDSSDDTYSLHAFGVYFSTGVLFAICTSPDRIMEKSASAMLLQSVDITLTTLDTALIEFGPAGFTNPPATIDRMGVVELATTEETQTGIDTTRAVTPFSLGRVLAQWANAFAPKAHGHSVSEITDLGTALANKSDKSHRHDAGDTTSGTFAVERIPKLSISWINNLAEILAGKAAAQHGHDAADTTSGVFNVGRIPALAMEKITGLANALAAKANITNPELYGKLTVRREIGNGWVEIHAGAADAFGTINFFSANGDRDAWFGFSDGGNGIYAYTAPGRYWNFTARPIFDNATPWDTKNFNPADKANALHSHDWSQITGKGDVVLTSATGLGRLNSGTLTTFGNLAEIVAKPTGFTTMVTNGSAGMPPYLGYFIKLATRDAGQGWTGLFSTFAGTGEQSDLYVGGTDQGHHQPVWTRVLTDANLKFANAGEMLNGAINYRMISPEGLWSFPKSIGPSGFVQIPGTDLIVQWGSNNASIAEGETHAYLPTAFGGGCLVAMAIPRNPGANIGMDFYMQIAGRYLDRIVFYANRANNSSGSMSGYEWMAIGLARGNPNPPYSSGGGGGGGWVPPDIEQP